MPDARGPAAALSIDRIVVRARGLDAAAARRLGAAIADSLPAALAGVVDRAPDATRGAPLAEPVAIPTLAVQVNDARHAPRAAADALASRLARPAGGTR